jgi:hypothetical protein
MNFKYNNKNNFFNNLEDLAKETETVLKNKDFSYFFLELSNIFKIPKPEIFFFFSKKIFFSYNVKKKKFHKSVKFFSFFFGIFYFFVYIFFIYLKKNNNKNKIIQNNFTIIIDNVNYVEDFERFNRLEHLFGRELVYNLANNFNYKINNKKIIYYKRFDNYLLNLKYVLKYLSFFFKILLISIKYKFNFFYIYINFIDNYFYYKTFFKKNKCKYMLTYIHYDTNNIKNFFLNQIGGRYIAIQRTLNHFTQIGFYHHCDICFTFSKKFSLSTAKHSIIKNRFPMGSFFLEFFFYLKKKKLKKISCPNFDILYIGQKDLFPGGVHDIYQNHNDDYLQQLNWIKLLAIKFPNLKIAYKNHPNNKHSNFEKDFFKNTRVNFIDQNLNSYFYCMRSKIILSWGSTMIIEMKSLNKNCFYLNPGNRNLQFLDEIGKTNKEINIVNYKTLENLIQKHIYKKNININFDKKNNEYYCLNSKNYTNNLYNFLMYNKKN